jgi:Carboxypeptidase regulatory-like domain
VRQQFLQIACSILASAALAAPALSQSETASVSGVVRDRQGAPQIDALVQLMRPDSSVVAVAHTDASGVFLLENLLPGVYELKASEEAFLPSLRQNLRVVAHRKTVANVTLSTLFEAVQWLPAERRSPNEPADDWKWTLRSETNRPVLRFSEEGPVLVSEAGAPQQSRARLTTSGGLQSFGDGGLRHDMEYEGTGRNGEHTLLRTSLNVTDGLQAEYMAAYENQIGSGQVIRTVAAYTDMPDLTGGPYGAGHYQAATLRTAETAELTPLLRAEIGNELLAMRLVGVEGGRQVVSRPFGSLIAHFGDTTIAYQVATSRMAQDPSALADEDTLLPPVAERFSKATLEHGLHQEIQLRHTGEHGTSVQVAAFHDRTVNPMVQGSGSISDLDAASGDMLVDPVSGIFRSAANTYEGYGFSVGAMIPLGPSIAFSGEVEAGPALRDTYLRSDTASQERSVEDMLGGLRPEFSPAVTVAAEGKLQKTATYWRASYRWQRQDTVTPVNAYASPASDAYLSVLLRQPIRVGRILPGGTKAVIDMRNLLAQGYCPFITPDGSTLFVAQADRSIAGGIAFTF